MNNIANIRHRAEEISDHVQEWQWTPIEIGYTMVSLGLYEAAMQLRIAADQGLGPDQLREMADRLDALSADTILLGEARAT